MSNITDERKGGTSASNAAYDELCPGRFQAQKGIPEPPPSEYAESGSKIHAALADSQNLTFMSSLTTDEREIFEACREQEKALCMDFFGEGTRFKVFREHRFYCRVMCNGEPMVHSGKADVTFRSVSMGLIIDYKCGHGEVQASSKNLQLRDLAVLAAQNLILKGMGVAIVQPPFKPEICYYNEEALVRAASEMAARVRKSHAPNPVRVPGNDQCNFCVAKHTCQEHLKWLESLVPASIINRSVPMEQWSGEQCAAFCDGYGAASKWLADAKQMIKDRLKANPDSIPGWSLGKGARMPTIGNPQDVFDRLHNLGGSLEQFMKCISVGKGDLEKVIREVTKAKGKGLKAEMDKLLEGLVTYNEKEGSIEKK